MADCLSLSPMNSGSFTQKSPSEPEASILSKDEHRLAFFGKKQQFRRNFGLISIVGLSATLMMTWEGILVELQYFVTNGGPTGTIGSFIFVMCGVLSQAMVMAEMASMIPLAGGQYNWVAVLAPKSASNILSYITGWVTTIAWQAAVASTSSLNAVVIQTLAAANHPDYAQSMKPWHATLIFYALIFAGLFVTTYLARLFPRFEAVVLVLHVVGFFAILITLVYLAPKSDMSVVWDTFSNFSGYASNGISFFLGSVNVMFTFMGIDAATHMAEEIENASVVMPRSMIIAVVLNGVMGFGMLVASLYCMGDPMKVLTSHTVPFVQMFTTVTGSLGGATALTAIILLISISGSFALLATASRMLWAFAREEGVPGSKYLSRVEPRTALPLWATSTTAVISLILALINLGSPTAFSALTGLTVAGFYSSFLISAAVMLYKRLTTPNHEIFWGNFQLGRAGIPVTIYAMVYSLIGWFFSFWPQYSPITVQTFNWSTLVYFTFLIVAVVFWAVHARKIYTGPKVEIERR